VARVHEHPVGGHQAQADRGAQPDQGEDTGVKQHEMLRGRTDDVTGTGQRQESDNNDDAGDRDRDDLRRVLGCRSATRRASMLTAAGTAASRGH
jgi:hypothetical protein